MLAPKHVQINYIFTETISDLLFPMCRRFSSISGAPWSKQFQERELLFKNIIKNGWLILTYNGVVAAVTGRSFDVNIYGVCDVQI